MARLSPPATFSKKRGPWLGGRLLTTPGRARRPVATGHGGWYQLCVSYGNNRISCGDSQPHCAATCLVDRMVRANVMASAYCACAALRPRQGT